MYLHLGQEVVVRQDQVLGIFDLDNSSQSHITRDFLRRAEGGGRVINVSDDLPKSFILTRDGDDVTVYLSQLSTATLLKRSEAVGFEL